MTRVLQGCVTVVSHFCTQHTVVQVFTDLLLGPVAYVSQSSYRDGTVHLPVRLWDEQLFGAVCIAVWYLVLELFTLHRSSSCTRCIGLKRLLPTAKQSALVSPACPSIVALFLDRFE
eukprot:GHUV01028030.1.p1 GENE.GHUV01028030.1~~GHUV01028030.1.p1  ORF type:complete len:117 (-),score=1.37 GHUV01028030.1:395-745(-)